MKKRYTLQYDWAFDVIVVIDHSICTDAHLHEINDFWSNSKERLRRASGDITKAVLKMLALQVLHDTITELAPEDMWRNNPPEGWPKLDGSNGILLEHVDYFEFDSDEMVLQGEEVLDAG